MEALSKRERELATLSLDDLPNIPEHVLVALALEMGSNLYPENRMRGARNALASLLMELGEGRAAQLEEK